MICPPGKSISFHKKETEKIKLVARPDMSLHVRHFQHLKLRETTTIRKVIAQNVQHTREITTSTRRNRQPIVWLPNYFNNLVGEVEAGYFAPRFDTPTMLDLAQNHISMIKK